MKAADTESQAPVRRARNYAADEKVHPAQIAAYRRMTVEQKLDRLAQLCRGAREILAIGIRGRHPEWTEEQVRVAVRERVMHAVS